MSILGPVALALLVAAVSITFAVCVTVMLHAPVWIFNLGRRVAKSLTLRTYLARVGVISIVASSMACGLMLIWNWRNPAKLTYSLGSILEGYATFACIVFWIFAILVGILLYPGWNVRAADQPVKPHTSD